MISPLPEPWRFACSGVWLSGPPAARGRQHILSCRYGGTFQNVSVKLPITLNKFFQPTEMASQDFFQRWKQLSR